MIFTGSALTIKRNFFAQTGNVAYSLDCIVDNTTGTYHFGLSGANGAQDFVLQSGKMYQGSTLLHGYQSNIQFTLDVQYASGAANVIKDGAALSFGAPKATGQFDYFYFMRENAGMGASFDLAISGDGAPTYVIQNQGYLLFSGQNAVTGQFSNTSAYSIRIFDSSMLATQNYTFGKLVGNIGAASSGSFAYSGDYSVLNTTDPILTTFNTNFGDVQQLFQIIDARTLNRFIYFTGPDNFDFNGTGILNRTLSYLNYSGGFAGASFPTYLTFSLEYISGSGSFIPTGTVLSGYSYFTTGFGNFLKSGILTGMTNTPTGNLFLSTTGWATGFVSGFFSGVGTGMASGLGFTGINTGVYTGLYTGLIFNHSGTLNLSSLLVGARTGSDTASFYTGQVYATGYLTNLGATTKNFLVCSITGCGFSISGKNSIVDICSNIGDNIIRSNWGTLTSFVQCLSGYSDQMGVTAIVRDSSTLDFISLIPGLTGNNIFIDPSDSLAIGGGYLTGGSNGGITSGLLVPIGPYTGSPNVILTGSGVYRTIFSGSGSFYTGLIPPYTKTFSGSWNFLTGLDQNSLVSMNIGTSTNKITGAGYFTPNDSMIFQVNHNIIDDNGDAARLVISGLEVLNPITKILNQP